MTTKILRIDASARTAESVSRALGDRILARHRANGPVTVTHRDLAADPLTGIDGAWIGANFTPAADRTDAQAARLAQSDALIDEVEAADILLIGLPVYNFGVPASLKTWIDLISRPGVTFAYSEDGPKGLLTGKRAIVAVASGGTEMGSEIDFATGYIRHILNFIGVSDVVFVAADQLALDAEGTIAKAHDQIEALPLAA